MMHGWGERSLDLPPFPSHIGDDHSPFEFSLAFAANSCPELRLLVEAQSELSNPTLRDVAEAGLKLNTELSRRFGLPMDRFEAVRDLFLPSEPEGAFALWHAACVWRGRAPEFKIYLNPQSQGEGRAREVVQEALSRLGMGDAAEQLFAHGGYRGPELDEICYFSLDLSRSARARVKIYYRHHSVTAAELEQALSYSAGHQPGDIQRFAERMAPGVERFDKKPVGSCFSYVQGSAEPLAATLHLPIAHYAANDQVSAARIARGLDAGPLQDAYVNLIEAFAGRPLAAGSGLQSYASFRREPGGLRHTVYISPEVYQPSMFHPMGLPLVDLERAEHKNDNAAAQKSA